MLQVKINFRLKILLTWVDSQFPLSPSPHYLRIGARNQSIIVKDKRNILFFYRQTRQLSTGIRGDEWSIKIFNCSQNFTFAQFARKI